MGQRTLANLSSFSATQISAIRANLQGAELRSVTETFEIRSSCAHGHVQAVSLATRRLGFVSLPSSKPCRERELVLAMVASRIINPATKLATTRLWPNSTLAQDMVSSM